MKTTSEIRFFFFWFFFLDTSVTLRDYTSITELSLQGVKYFDRASSSIRYSN